jgi:tetratricopeptide (TPR) repeat protein
MVPQVTGPEIPREERFSPLHRYPPCANDGSDAAELWVDIELNGRVSGTERNLVIPLCKKCAAEFGVETTPSGEANHVKSTSFSSFMVKPLQRAIHSLRLIGRRLDHWIGQSRYRSRAFQFLRRDLELRALMEKNPDLELRFTGTRLIPQRPVGAVDGEWFEYEIRFGQPADLVDSIAATEIEVHARTARFLLSTQKPTGPLTTHYYLRLDIAYCSEQRILIDIYQEPSLLAEDALRQLVETIRQLPRPSFSKGISAFSMFAVFGYQSPEWAEYWRSPFAGLPEAKNLEVNGTHESLFKALSVFAERPKEIDSRSSWGVGQYTAFLNVAPDNNLARMLRSGLFSDSGSFQQASEDALYVATSPSDMDNQGRAWAYLRYAWNQLKMGHDDVGIQAARQAIHINPLNVKSTAAAVETLFEFNQLAAAKDLLETAERDGLESPVFDVARGRLSWIGGDPGGARNWFNQAIERDPKCVSAYFHRSSFNANQSRWADAENDLTHCIELTGSSPDSLVAEFYLRRGRVRMEQQHHESAMSDFNEVLRLQPDHVDCLFNRGQLLLAEGKLELVIEAADQIISLAADGPGGWGLRATAHFQLDQFDDALPDFARAFELGLNSPSLLCERASIWLSRQQYQEALADVEAAIEVDPEHARAHDLRGLLHENDGEEFWNAAEESYSRAISLSPDWALPWFHRANLLAMSKRNEEALEDYRKTVELIPGFATAWKNLASCHVSREEFDDALNAFERALEIDPELVVAHLERGILLGRMSRISDAILDFDAILECEPENEIVLALRARSFIITEQYDKAIADFDRLVDLNPSVPALIGRGTVWLYKDCPDEAEKDFAEAIQLQPESAEQIQLQQLFIEAGVAQHRENYQQVIEKAEAALQIDGNSVDGLMIRAGGKWYLEDWVEAGDDFSRVLQRDSDRLAAYSGRGQVRVELGEYEEAILDLDRAIELATNDEEQEESFVAYALNGRALAKAGLERWNDAFEDFDQSIRYYPENAWVQYNLGRMYDLRGDRRSAIVCFRLALVLRQPRLSPRQRERAQAYLERYRSAGNPTGNDFVPEDHG